MMIGMADNENKTMMLLQVVGEHKAQRAAHRQLGWDCLIKPEFDTPP